MNTLIILSLRHIYCCSRRQCLDSNNTCLWRCEKYLFAMFQQRIWTHSKTKNSKLYLISFRWDLRKSKISIPKNRKTSRIYTEYKIKPSRCSTKYFSPFLQLILWWAFPTVSSDVHLIISKDLLQNGQPKSTIL